MTQGWNNWPSSRSTNWATPAALSQHLPTFANKPTQVGPNECAKCGAKRETYFFKTSMGRRQKCCWVVFLECVPIVYCRSVTLWRQNIISVERKSLWEWQQKCSERKKLQNQLLADGCYKRHFLGSATAYGRLRFVYAHVVSYCVYELTKQMRQCIKGKNQICFTIGQIQALTSFFKRAPLIALPPELCGFVCSYHTADPGQNPNLQIKPMCHLIRTQL